MNESIKSVDQQNVVIRQPITSKNLEDRADELILQPWATKYREAVRNNIEPEDETYRTCFRRDRDRILYSKAFRRLQYKTQVLVNSAGDHYRTRLTHTLEVQQLAMSIADAIGANRDLTEAIALGHDLGHTPFGHAVERVLNKILISKEQGGFSHAIQSVRYLEHLDSHNGLEGLNLCMQVREGILKHDTDIFEYGFGENQIKQWDCKLLSPTKPGNIEAQIAYWADKIAYLSHDWDDFKNCGLYQEAIAEQIDGIKELEDIMNYLAGKIDDNWKLRDLIRNLHNNLIGHTFKILNDNKISKSTDIIELTEMNMTEYRNNKHRNNEDVSNKDVLLNSLVVNFEKEYREQVLKARKLLGQIYAQSPTVARMDERAVCMVSEIFNKYENKTHLLPWKTQQTIKAKDNKWRVIADHMACMTDRYAYKIYDELFLSGGVSYK
jgi:dGTPase